MRALRVFLSVVVLAILPMAEVAHAMPDHPVAQMQGMDMPDSHASHSDMVSCQILCLGWVEAVAVTRPTAPAIELMGLLPTTPVALTCGLSPAPQRRPPKGCLSA